MKMVINSTESDLAGSVLIITTDECGVRQQTALAADVGDENFDLEYGFTKNKKSKSFIRSQTKSLNNEHRNKSVPHNLQVCHHHLRLIRPCVLILCQLTILFLRTLTI